MEKLSALDVFSGAGGLSCGLAQDTFSIEGAIEMDAWAAETFSKNFPNSKLYCTDIKELSDSFIKKTFSGIDLVMGGPPCQGFSISASNRRKPLDPRNFLYREFLRIITVLKPKLLLIENVKEIGDRLNEKGGQILNEIISFLHKEGYLLDYKIINTKNFGIPQDRARFFLLGSKLAKPIFPEPTHSAGEDLFCQDPYLTFWEATSDLPEVKPRMHKEGTIFEYKIEPKNDYQKLLRKGCKQIYNHVPMRHTDRIIERFSNILIGKNGKELPIDHQPRKRGQSKIVSGKIYDQNHRRLDPEKPSKTITASFYSSFIHPFQNRNITVREAARVQGFPDKFIFYGKKTRLSHKLLLKKGIFEDVHLDQFNQVGNAIPPILAKKLARSLKRALKK